MANPSRNLEKLMNERKLAEVFEGWVQSMRSELKHRTIGEVPRGSSIPFSYHLAFGWAATPFKPLDL
jgi:hypothetical protein